MQQQSQKQNDSRKRKGHPINSRQQKRPKIQKQQQQGWILTSYNLLKSNKNIPKCLQDAINEHSFVSESIEKMDKPVATTGEKLLQKFKIVISILPKLRKLPLYNCIMEAYVQHIWKSFVENGLSYGHFSEKELSKAMVTTYNNLQNKFLLFALFYMGGFQNKQSTKMTIPIPKTILKDFTWRMMITGNPKSITDFLLTYDVAYNDSLFDAILNYSTTNQLAKLKILAQLFPDKVNYKYVSKALDYYIESKYTRSSKKVKILQALMNYIRNKFPEENLTTVKKIRQSQTQTQKKQRQRKQRQLQQQIQKLPQQKHDYQKQVQDQRQELKQQLRFLQGQVQTQARRRAVQGQYRRIEQAFRQAQRHRNDGGQLYMGSPRLLQQQQPQATRGTSRRRLDF